MRRSRVLSSRFRERVVVTTKLGESFSGVLYSADHLALVLRSAEAVGVADNKTNLPLDGEILILLADVLFIQRP